MRAKKAFILVIMLLAVGALMVSATDVLAQRGGRPGLGVTGQFQYVIKFVCGQLFFEPTDNPSGQRDGAPGQYYTDINIHNPNDEIVRAKKKFALDGPKAQLHGPVTSVEEFVLDPDTALQIQCTDIRRLTMSYPFGSTYGSQGQFIKGFVVILSRVRLDITAIYTVCPSEDPDAATEDLALACDFDGDGTGSTRDLGEGVQSLDVVYITEPSPVPAPSVLLPASVSASQLTPGGELVVELNARRFLALESSRLLVFDASGRLLHDSGFTTRTRLSWTPQTADGRPLANGVYFYAIMAQDVFGRVGYHIGKFAVLR